MRPRLDGQHVLFVVNEDWMFCSHRMALARAAREAGARVHVATRVARHGDAIRAEGFDLVALPWRRGGAGPVNELRTVAGLVRAMRAARPGLVHVVGVRPMVTAGIAARIAGRRRVAYALTGFGVLAGPQGVRARTAAALARRVLRHVLGRPGCALIVQNPDDERDVVLQRLADPGRIVVVRGSGVDVTAFRPLPEPDGPFTVALAARMVRSKGIVELVQASRLLQAAGRPVRVVLAGDPDPENPGSVREATLRRWQSQGLVEWLGRVEDVRTVWARAHVAVLPSWREGLPRALLEAAAYGRALIATDVPGCREIVRDGVTGLRVPPRDARALARAIARMRDDAAGRRAMARAAREVVEREFSDDVVIDATMAVWARLLRGGFA